MEELKKLGNEYNININQRKNEILEDLKKFT